MNTKPIELSQHYPPFVAMALQQAAFAGDLATIDQITDATLVKDGLARPRGDISRLGEMREAAARRYGARK